MDEDLQAAAKWWCELDTTSESAQEDGCQEEL